MVQGISAAAHGAERYWLMRAVVAVSIKPTRDAVGGDLSFHPPITKETAACAYPHPMRGQLGEGAPHRPLGSRTPLHSPPPAAARLLPVSQGTPARPAPRLILQAAAASGVVGRRRHAPRPRSAAVCRRPTPAAGKHPTASPNHGRAGVSAGGSKRATERTWHEKGYKNVAGQAEGRIKTNWHQTTHPQPH